MRNDDPTSLRRGFGYRDALVSGITDFRAPPEASKMNFDLKELAAKNELVALVKKSPAIGLELRKFMKANAGKFNSQDWLFIAQCIGASLCRDGFVAIANDGATFECTEVIEIGWDQMIVLHEGNRRMLSRWYITDIKPNI